LFNANQASSGNEPSFREPWFVLELAIEGKYAARGDMTTRFEVVTALIGSFISLFRFTGYLVLESLYTKWNY
jgi:hypothetical protein